MTHVNLRIVARYYDDQRHRHKLKRCYHADLKKGQLLKVQLRPKETPLVRGGFRCYTWTQIVDFLAALCAPYDPAYRDKNSRPRLLPSLTSLRLDLVNFYDTLIAHSRYLQPLSGNRWCARVIRAWKGSTSDSVYGDIADEDMDDHVAHFGGYHPRLGALPPAPVEDGHPPSTRDEETVIWKRVPTSRDGEERSWVQFSRFSGYEITDPDWDSDDEGICPCCGESHPGSSFLEFINDEL